MERVDETAGSLLRRARVGAGMSQAELAFRAGVAQSVISAYEAGGGSRRCRPWPG